MARSRLSRQPRVLLLIVIALACGAGRALAQDEQPIASASPALPLSRIRTPPQQTQAEREAAAGFAAKVIVDSATGKVRENREEAAVVYPYGLSGTAQSGISLLASSENKRVSVKAGLPFGKLMELVISASAPLDEDADRSVVVQLDGLANKGKAGVEWRYGQQRLPSLAALESLTKTLVAACLKTNPAPSLPQAGDPGMEVKGCSLADLEKDPDAARALAALFPRRTAWFVSIKGDVAAETFEFADSTTLADAKKREWSPSGTATFGALLPQNAYVAAALRFENGHEAAKNQAICTITGTGVATACPIKAVGGPKDKNRGVFEAEMRKYAGPHVGISGIFRRDWREKETSIEFPTYFVRDKDGGLTGGASYGFVWSSDDKVQGHRFTVFVGQTFGLNAGS